ncbi:MAG TPA: CDP-alcohol phosphatidyltransferase family protein [Candidatus Cybelea sp.]|jgi:phosphatidylglycerophosphate synthase|nr:CDP-alcohol phosphatidyltransferase family protein [Candidatus Cybelea sp.]
MSPEPQRRPLATRERGWAKALAQTLNRAGVAPNAISVASLVFAVGAGIALWSTSESNGITRALELLAAAACIQFRLLCNMLDGMVAVEGGRQTRYGEIFNDMPDRFADVAILVGAGYALSGFSWGVQLGWLAATLAVLTAYVRLLGGAMSTRQYFTGPMAKPHRMAVLTVACVLSTLEPLVDWHGQVLAAGLVVIVIGCLVTLVRRTSQIVSEIGAR